MSHLTQIWYHPHSPLGIPHRFSPVFSSPLVFLFFLFPPRKRAQLKGSTQSSAARCVCTYLQPGSKRHNFRQYQSYDKVENATSSKAKLLQGIQFGEATPRGPSPEPGCLSWDRSSLIPLALSLVSPELRNPPAIICIPVPGTAEMLLEVFPEAPHQQESCSPHWGVLSPAQSLCQTGGFLQEGWAGICF